jgi:hypothetical protein
VGHHRRGQDFCEDDAAEVKNAMLRMALICDTGYDATNAVAAENGEPAETGHSKRKLKKQPGRDESPR